MKNTTDVIIIGGGIIGCSIAYFLCKQGVQVIVLESGDIGAQSSSAAVGLLAPMRPLSGEDPFKTHQLAGMARFSSFTSELEAASGISIGYEQTGTLRLLPPEKVIPARSWAEEWRRAGYHIEVLTPEETSRHEPLLAQGLHGAVRIAEEAQVTPRLLMQAFAQAARNGGTLLYDHTEVVSFQLAETEKRVTGVWTLHGDLLTCNQLILATGAWTAPLGAQLHATLPVRPVRGELVALRQPSPPIRHIVFDEGIVDQDIYIAPKPDGTVVVGATKADAGFDLSVSAGGIHHLLQVAFQLVPTLAGCAVERIWAGLRPKTPDSRPLLGPVPGWENVIVASGHGGFGITLSIITGETIAELLVTGQAPEVIRPFSPG